MLVDFAPYFTNMFVEDRILWNADAFVNRWDTKVDWTYTDEKTGRTIIKSEQFGLIQQIEMVDAEGATVYYAEKRLQEKQTSSM